MMARGLPFWSRLFARLMCSRKTDEVLVTHRSPSCAQGAARHQGILALEAWKLATQGPERGLALSTCGGYSINALFGWRYRVPHAHAWLERRRHTTKTALAARATSSICDWAPASTLRQHQHRAEQSLIHSTASPGTLSPSPERLMIASFCRCFCFSSPVSTPAGHRGSDPCSHASISRKHMQPAAS